MHTDCDGRRKEIGPMVFTEDAEDHSDGLPEISHDIWDQGIIRDTDFEHGL